MKINIVIPCYNEQEVLHKTIDVLGKLAAKIKCETSVDTVLLLVDDGSKDNTWEIIKEAAQKHSFVSGIKLSHNRGHQNALWAGMEASIDHCDAMVSIDADLQDDENVIVDMVRQLKEGKDIVYGVRKERKTDSFFKRFTAQAFYKIMQMADKEVLYNHADFRLMSNRALKALMQYPERNLFLRAIVRELGFKEGYVYYDRKAREAGESKYPLKKMLAFSIHHFLLSGSIEVYYAYGIDYDVCGSCYDSVCFSRTFSRKNNSRLDINVGFYVVYWWYHYNRCWHHRIVYRQDIYGGETPPKIFY